MRYVQALKVEAVVEVGYDKGFTFWPTLGTRRHGPVALSGDLTDEQVGSVVQAILHWFYWDEHNEAAASIPIYLDRVAAALADNNHPTRPLAFGGPCFVDVSSGTTMLPGCCLSVDERSEVFDVLAGESAGAWLGHSPDTGLTVTDGRVVITQDFDDGTSARIDAAPAAVEAALATMEADVDAFLSTLRPWAARHTPGYEDEVVAAIAEAVVIDVGAT